MKNVTQQVEKLSLLVSGLCLSLVGCADSFDTSFFEKDIQDPEFNIEVAGLPIGFTTYTAKELFEEIGDDITVGTTNDNGKSLISFSYSESLSSEGNENFVTVDNQTIDGNFDLLASSGLVGSVTYVSGSLPGDQATSTFEEVKELTKSGGEPLDGDLTTLDFTAGSFTIELATTTEAETIVTFTIPSLLKKSDDTEYSQTFVLNNNSGADSDSFSINLIDYKFDLTTFNPNTNKSFNNIALELDAIVNFQDGDMVSSDDTITYEVTINSAAVETAEGDFKQKTFNVDNRSFELDFFNELGEGTIQFENPTLKLLATSGYGFPIGLTLESISSTNGTVTNNLAITDATPTDDNIEPVTGSTDNYAIIDGATSNGATATSTILLNNSNSNLTDLLNDKPTQFNLDVTALSNPNSTTANTNFYDVANTLDLSIEVELPLYVTFEDLRFSPDPFDFDTEVIADNASSLSLRIASKNSIPLTGTVSLEFLKNTGSETEPVYEIVQYTDENNNLVDFTANVTAITAAPVDANGFSTYTLDSEGVLKQGNTEISPNVSWLNFSKEQIAVIDQVTQVRTVVSFDTKDSNNDGNPDAAKIQSTDQLRLDLAIKGDLKIKIDDDEDTNN